MINPASFVKSDNFDGNEIFPLPTMEPPPMVLKSLLVKYVEVSIVPSFLTNPVVLDNLIYVLSWL